MIRAFIPSLRDPAQQVRKTAGLVMTHLILKDMVKVKGQVSEMAVLLIDPVPQIAALAKNFFNELSHKGNAIYNLLPDIISRLSDPEGGVEEEPFHTIMRYSALGFGAHFSCSNRFRNQTHFES
ncbi:condensin complex subunit 1-like [Nannospalax galili]|uniref:condensin complex subunit 1-like n=1 Tax=Nannospalax galili TaxID=1026970 RepID=UPI0004ED126F|nr:condensin complex subunit 1-like [Nannospalax galili]